MTHMFDRWCIPSLPVVAKYVLLSQNILRLHCEKKEKYSSDKRNKMRHLFAWKLESGIQCAGAPLCQTSKVWRVHAQDLTQANFCIFLRTNIMPPRWRSPELITHFYLKMGKDLKKSVYTIPTIIFGMAPRSFSHPPQLSCEHRFLHRDNWCLFHQQLDYIPENNLLNHQ